MGTGWEASDAGSVKRKSEIRMTKPRKIRIRKSEILNKSQIRMNGPRGLGFRISVIGICFGFRVSSFGFEMWVLLSPPDLNTPLPAHGYNEGMNRTLALVLLAAAVLMI